MSGKGPEAGQAAKGGKVDSATEPEEVVGKSDDKCIGNRRFRTIFLCLVLEAFCIFAAGFLWELVENAKDLKDYSDAAASRVHGANFMFAGLMFCIIFLFVSMILLFAPSCDPSTNGVARAPGLGLLLGAICYLLGWVWYITTDKEINYDLLTEDEQHDKDAEC